MLNVLQNDENQCSAVDQITERDAQEINQKVNLLLHQIFPERKFINDVFNSVRSLNDSEVLTLISEPIGEGF